GDALPDWIAVWPELLCQPLVDQHYSRCAPIIAIREHPPADQRGFCTHRSTAVKPSASLRRHAPDPRRAGALRSRTAIQILLAEEGNMSTRVQSPPANFPSGVAPRAPTDPLQPFC